MLGELGISPDVSEEMEEEGEVGGLSSWCEDPGVGWSKAAAVLVRRRLDGGMIELPWLGSGLMSSWWSDMSEATEERGEPGESAIGVVVVCWTGWLGMRTGELNW